MPRLEQRLPMSRAELEGLGLSDEMLFAEHVAYFREPAVQPHPHGVDTPDQQVLRRRVFDEVMGAWYGERPRLHAGI